MHNIAAKEKQSTQRNVSRKKNVCQHLLRLSKQTREERHTQKNTMRRPNESIIRREHWLWARFVRR